MTLPKDPTEEWKEWMKRNGNLELKELAERWGMNYGTLRNWSSKGVPRSKWELVRTLIGSQSFKDRLVVEVSEEEFDKFNQAALDQGLKIKDWMVRACKEATEENLKEWRRVAEQPASYGLTAEQRAEVDEATDEVIAELEEEAGESV